MESMEERTRRHVATLAVLNAACALAMAVFAGLTLFAVVGASDPVERSYYLFATVFFALLGAVNGLLWHGLQQLSPTARLVQLAVGAVALIGFPLGTAWGAYAMWVLLGQSARRVFSSNDDAQRMHPARPYRLVVVAGVGLGLAVAVAGLFVVPGEFIRLYERERELSGSEPPNEARRGPLDDVQIIIIDSDNEAD